MIDLALAAFLALGVCCAWHLIHPALRRHRVIGDCPECKKGTCRE